MPTNDWASDKIVQAQLKAYQSTHAQWTHAAVYLGDGEHICEANFGIRGRKNGVMVRQLQEYADGCHAIKVRRPIGLNDAARYKIAIGALTNLKKSYNFSFLLKLAYRAWRGIGMNDTTCNPISINSNALVCSTLYADALMWAAHISVARLSNTCVPAMLSCSPLFDDSVVINWLEIH